MNYANHHHTFTLADTTERLLSVHAPVLKGGAVVCYVPLGGSPLAANLRAHDICLFLDRRDRRAAKVVA